MKHNKSINVRAFKHLLLLIVGLFFIPFYSNGQNGFRIDINSQLDEYPACFIQDSNNDFVGIIWKSVVPYYERQTYIYKIGPTGDTTSYLFALPDTILNLYNIIQVNASPIEYLASGTGYQKGGSSGLQFTYFTKLNQNMEVIWQKHYQLLNDGYGNYWSNLLKTINNDYLFVGSNDAPYTMYFLKLSAEGDSLKYRLYQNDSAGTAMDLTYNYDSTAYWVHTHFAHYDPSGPESQCITVDFNFNQTKVMYYPRWFSTEMSAKLLPDRSLVAGARYWYSQTPPLRMYLAAFKLDTAFNVLDSCYFTDPDTESMGGFTTMDFYYPSCIYVCGTHNHHLGIWVPQPSWIVIAKMNENLDLEYEKYIGGDAYYSFKAMTATSDGGVLVSGTRYDYLTQGEEHDAVIIKLDSTDFIVGNTEHKPSYLSDAIVYPNPGKDEMILRTALKSKIFEMNNVNGQKVIFEKIVQLITKINVSNLNKGTYTWKIYDGQKVYETGKWIKQ